MAAKVEGEEVKARLGQEIRRTGGRVAVTPKGVAEDDAWSLFATRSRNEGSGKKGAVPRCESDRLALQTLAVGGVLRGRERQEEVADYSHRCQVKQEPRRKKDCQEITKHGRDGQIEG